MTRKLKDLKDLIKPFWISEKEIVNLEALAKRIAEKFGTSVYIRRLVMGELETFGFLKHTEHINLFKLNFEGFEQRPGTYNPEQKKKVSTPSKKKRGVRR